MSLTLSQIAENLNLSHTTVSRVLNGKSDKMISKETQERVLKAAHEAGYLPNLAARSLRNAKTNMIAVFGSPTTGIWSGIAPQIVQGAAQALHAHKYDCFFGFSYGDNEAPVGTIPNWRFDGALVLEAPSAQTLDFLKRSRIPWVAVNEEGHADADAILSDEKAGVAMALEHLTKLGHTRIAFAGPVSDWHYTHYSILERWNSLRDWLIANNLPIFEPEAIDMAPRDRRDFLTERILQKGVTAILAYDHVIAMDIYSAAARLGLRIPQDFSVICFNDDLVSGRLYPRLTVVAPQGRVMGAMGAERLLAQIASPRTEEAQVIRVEPEFLSRDSTAQINA